MVLPFVQVFSKQRPVAENSLAANFYAKESGSASAGQQMKHSIDFMLDFSANGIVGSRSDIGPLKVDFEVWMEEFLRDDRSFQLLAVKKGERSLIQLRVITHNHIEVILGDKKHHDVVGGGVHTLKLNQWN